MSILRNAILLPLLLTTAVYAQNTPPQQTSPNDTIRLDIDCNPPQGIVDADWELWFKIKKGEDVKVICVPVPNSTDSKGAALALAAAVKSATGEKAKVKDDGDSGEEATQEDVQLPAGWTYCVDAGNHAYKDQNEDGIYVPKSSPHIKIRTNGGDNGDFEYRKPTTHRVPRKKRGETPRAFQ